MAATAPLAYKASQPYVQNRLEAPRYVVPPPNLNYEGGKPVFTLTNAAPHVDVSGEFGNPVFIRALASHGAYHVNHLGLEWKYDQRRAAQKILPFLLLGPGTAAQDVNFVRTEGITLLVAVRSASAARLQARLLDPSKFASSAGLQTLTLDLDSPYDMITKLPRAIKAINDHFPHWFNDEFKKFNDQPDRLPFDQHCLIALVAPRSVLIGCAKEDTWSNPAGQFEMLQAADPVYRFLGTNGLDAKEMPGTNQLVGNRLGYFIRPGNHSMTKADWKMFLDFADKTMP